MHVFEPVALAAVSDTVFAAAACVSVCVWPAEDLRTTFFCFAGFGSREVRHSTAGFKAHAVSCPHDGVDQHRRLSGRVPVGVAERGFGHAAAVRC